MATIDNCSASGLQARLLIIPGKFQGLSAALNGAAVVKVGKVGPAGGGGGAGAGLHPSRGFSLSPTDATAWLAASGMAGEGWLVVPWRWWAMT